MTFSYIAESSKDFVDDGFWFWSLILTMQLEFLLFQRPVLLKNRLRLCFCGMLCSSVGVSGNMFSSPDTSYFSSSEGMYTGVEAYIKARQGYLYPLPTGICFLESVCLI